MISDNDMRQRLNLVRTARSFVLQEVGATGEANVASLSVVPKSSGIYWVPGKTILKSGRTIESVFRVDTDAGGTLVSAYWWIDGMWYAQEDVDAINAIGVSRDQIFPFDWAYDVPLEEDIFHES